MLKIYRFVFMMKRILLFEYRSNDGSKSEGAIRSHNNILAKNRN